MAMASLHRKPIPYHLDPLIYRVLEAKFSAETAPGVGKTTSLLWMDREGVANSIGWESADAIKKIWNDTLTLPEPGEAIAIISSLTRAKKSA